WTRGHVLAPLARGADAPKPTPVPFKQIRPILARHCIACHDARQAEGELVMETYTLLMKGGEDGPAILPGKADQSPLIRQVEHKDKPFMPPPKKGDKLSPDEIALLRRWIDGGAPGPAAGEDATIAVAANTAAPLPKVTLKAAPRRAVQAMAYEPKSKLLALAVLNQVELRSVENQAVLATLGPHAGHVNAVAFSADGAKLIAAAGDPGVSGEVTIWNVADGKRLRRFTGHKDALYAVAISPDGKTLATGSYDQRIILWDLSQDPPKPLHTLEGHNGAVFDLAFRPDGKVLASASADRTVKLWDVAAGKRLDTRSEPTKEQQTLAFSPDGQRLYAAGADNRVRVWRISPTAAEGTNTLLLAQFAHEGSILRLVLSADGKTLLTSADDKTVKLWDANKVELRRAIDAQSDWPTAIALALDARVAVVGRLDGTVGYYESTTARPIAPPKPELANLEPRGMRRGTSAEVKLTGKEINTATSIKVAGNDKISAELLPPDRANPNARRARITTAADAPLGAVDLVAIGPGGPSAAAKFILDDLPQVEALEKPASTTRPAAAALATTLPVTFGGNLTARGQADAFAFDARAGQTIVIDCAAKRFASKADPIVTLLDPAGHPLTVSTDDATDPDPLLVQVLPADGRYTLRVNDLQGAASPQHYFRMSVGTFPFVTGAFPLAVAPDRESEVRLIGYNLPTDAKVKVKAPAAGEAALPIDRAALRTRRALSVLVGYPDEATECEPDDTPDRAMRLPLPGGVSGRFDSPGDVDCYRFAARKGEPLILETQAAQRGSPADTRVEVLWPDGRPVERVQLQAVRDSHITFRAVDASAVGARLFNWEEMELNQYLYLGGEVVRLDLYPRGPDSEYNFYAVGGRRRTFFDTSAAAHAYEEKCYIVEPHPPGEKLAENGLPVFTLHYANDDDQLRQLGADSRLSFTPPADGDYLVRVSDSRGFGGARFVYRLVVRPARPDFTASVEGFNPGVPAGGGRPFIVRVNRIDNFDGPVTVRFAGVPSSVRMTNPITVEAGRLDAQGTIYAPADAPATQPASTAPASPAVIKVTATATIGGKPVTRPLPDLPKVTVTGRPQFTVALDPIDPKQDFITVHPGQRTPAWLRLKRGALKGPVSFEVENLPHGVIVSDIGLSGVLIPDGQAERQIFIQCAPWVAAQARPCHARALSGENPTSPPVMLRVVAP
ncbi:MAG TPA: c-type cytochrome domain-containing protein, partial [Tepidisphaeraceae bacterium]